jgi:carbonic anhydrase
MKTIEITYRFLAGSPPIRERPHNARAARDRLDDGNRAFAGLFESAVIEHGVTRRILDIDPRDLGIAALAEGKPRQRPFAAIVGCADARVPVELVFNEGPNDLFVVRVAGNGLGQEVLGSLRYAVDHLADNLQLIVVLGHSGCGAVSAAVDIFLDPTRYLALATCQTLRSVLDRVLVVVHASARHLLEIYGPQVAARSGYREALLETAVAVNAALAAHTIQRELGADRPTVRAAYGVYLLETRQVWAPIVAGKDAERGLADPPLDFAGFIALGDALARSPRIASLLE